MLHTLPLGQASQLPHGSLQCSLTRGAGIVVLYVLVLAALAAVSGFMLGQWRSRWAGIAAGVALAFISALVLRKLELRAGIGIPAVAAVLAISQAAYLIGLMRGARAQAPDSYLTSKSATYQTTAPMVMLATNVRGSRAHLIMTLRKSISSATCTRSGRALKSLRVIEIPTTGLVAVGSQNCRHECHSLQSRA
jgi:hypothetical protein